MKITPSENKSDFYRINSFDRDEIYRYGDSDELYDNGGNAVNHLSKNDLIHLAKGKPLLDTTDGEYLQFIQLTPDAMAWLASLC